MHSAHDKWIVWVEATTWTGAFTTFLEACFTEERLTIRLAKFSFPPEEQCPHDQWQSDEECGYADCGRRARTDLSQRVLLRRA